MAKTSRCNGDGPMNMLSRKEIPEDILKGSVLAHIAAAYFSVGKRLERKTQCSATRGFILSTLRDGTTLNQNQIATLLGFDRTVVHRAIKSLAKEGLVSEHMAKSVRAIQFQLTVKVRRYREMILSAPITSADMPQRQTT